MPITASLQRADGPPAPGTGAVRLLLYAPFDALRVHHAHAVQAGLLPRSLLASSRFERWIGLMETLSLGPLARHR